MPAHRRLKFTVFTACMLFIAVPGMAETPESWYQSGQAELERALAYRQNTGLAKNIILFVGDGMGISTVTAARIYDGQSRGQTGEENSLSFESLPFLALSKTYNTNQQTPDSAGTMTAMMSGIKTKAGLIGLNQNAERANCRTSLDADIPTFLEQAEQAGLSTGIVTTTRITHATPAATYAHIPERDWEDDADLPTEAIEDGCKDIAQQLIEFEFGNGIEVTMGGGRASFLPNTEIDPQTERPGNRRDGRDLISEWQDKYKDGTYLWNREQLAAVDPASTDRLLGLFSPSHMRYHQDRQGETSAQPSLPLMTQKTIEILQKNPKGFFLMVEAGRIDHAHHAGNAQRALQDTSELSDAVNVALALTNSEDTLIIVTADHSHTLTMAGYPTRGNPILGKVVSNDGAGNPESNPQLAEDQLPYTTLGYRNGRGFATGMGGDTRYRTASDPGRKDLTKVDSTHPDYHQEALVPLDMETHAAEDVAIYAGGPWAHLFQQTHEQHYIYHVMRHAAQLDLRAAPVDQ
ncbi:MAG: alkaline phosphatase [Cellvibrionaceae bacterium]